MISLAFSSVCSVPSKGGITMSRELRSRARRDAALDGNGGACVARPHHYHHPQSCPLPCYCVKAAACSRLAAWRPAKLSLRQSASHPRAIAPELRRGAAHRHRHVARRGRTRRLAGVGELGKMRCPCHDRRRNCVRAWWCAPPRLRSIVE
jgi:hypothetical protein